MQSVSASRLDRRHENNGKSVKSCETSARVHAILETCGIQGNEIKKFQHLFFLLKLIASHLAEAGGMS